MLKMNFKSSSNPKDYYQIDDFNNKLGKKLVGKLPRNLKKDKVHFIVKILFLISNNLQSVT